MPQGRPRFRPDNHCRIKDGWHGAARTDSRKQQNEKIPERDADTDHFQYCGQSHRSPELGDPLPGYGGRRHWPVSDGIPHLSHGHHRFFCRDPGGHFHHYSGKSGQRGLYRRPAGVPGIPADAVLHRAVLFPVPFGHGPLAGDVRDHPGSPAYYSIIALAPAVFFVTFLSSFRGYFQAGRS